MSIFSPAPKREPIRYPRRLPNKTLPSHLLDPDLELCLLMNYAEGDEVRDYSTNNLHGAMNGPAWIQSSVGFGFHFIRSEDDYIEVPNDAALNFGTDQDFTVMAVFRSEAQEAVKERIVNKQRGPSGDYKGWQLRTAGDNLLVQANDAAGSLGSATGTTNIHDGEWHLGAGVWDRGAGEIRVFTDGGPAEGTAALSAGDVSTTTTLGIGIRTEDLNNSLEGDVAMVWIFSAAKSEQFITRTYQELEGAF